MKQSELFRHRLGNWLQSVILILVMAGMLGYLALILAGPEFALAVIAAVVGLYWLNPWIASTWLLQLYRARPISPRDAPELHWVLGVLSERAGLACPPRLYHLPNSAMNAFAVGQGEDAAIALSDGLLRRLNLYELAGVLGHEISHIRGNDIRVMGFADVSGRLTRLLSLVGAVLLVVNMPLVLFADLNIGWLPIIILLLAPWVSDLAQLALSRVREYQADLGSAQLLGDPGPLIAALSKLDHLGVNFLERWVRGTWRQDEPSLLRTHPTTGERIRRLSSLAPDSSPWPSIEQWPPRPRASRLAAQALHSPRWPF